MNSDIRLSVTFWQHPKTIKLMRKAGIETIRSLQILWCFAAQEHPCGVLEGMDLDDVEIAADWQGEAGAFVAALLSGGWLEERDGTYAIHGWQERQTYVARAPERREQGRKAAEARWRNRYGTAQKSLEQEIVDADGNAQGMKEQYADDADGNARSIREQCPSSCSSSSPLWEKENTPDGVFVDAGAVDAPQPGERAQPPASSACPYDAIVGLYHEAFPEHPRVAVVNARRRGAIKARWTEAGERLRKLGRDTSAAERIDYFRRLFAKASRSDFLTGKKAFRDGTVYRVDFDKLMSPAGFVGMIEGRYDNREVA